MLFFQFIVKDLLWVNGGIKLDYPTSLFFDNYISDAISLFSLLKLKLWNKCAVIKGTQSCLLIDFLTWIPAQF